MATVIAQPVGEVDLHVFQGSPWDLALVVEGTDWSGTYTCDVRVGRAETATLVAEPTVVASFSSPDTTFTITLSEADADEVEPGAYFYDIRKSTGEVRFSGRVKVKETVTP